MGPFEQKHIKNFGEKGAWAYPWTAQFFWVPILCQERVKLRTSNLLIHSQGPSYSEQKPIKNFRERGEWAYPGTAQFFGVPLLSHSQERVG